MKPYDPISGSHDIARFDEETTTNRLHLLERRTERLAMALHENERVLNHVCGWCLVLSVILSVVLAAVFIYAVTR